MVKPPENREHPYTVAELIAELGKLPADMRAMVRGYEGGYHDAAGLEVKRIALNVHNSWYYGPHDEADSYTGEGAKIIDAVII
jgi:hypothetical protein